METILDVLGFIGNFAGIIGGSIYNAMEFIGSMFISLPVIFINIFNNLPSIFQYGLSSLLGVIIVITLLKVVALLLSFK